MNRRTWEMTFEEIRAYLKSEGKGIVIPFGIIEPHGPHLPMGTDTFLALGISERIAEKFGWLVAAPLNYGVNNTLAIYPGAVSIDEQTYENLVYQVAEGFIRIGFTHVVLNNGHGPNHNALEKAAKKLHMLYPNSRIFIIEWWHMDNEARESVYEGKSAGHAGVDETAAVMHFNPSHVKKEKFDPRGTWVWTEGFKTYPAPASCLLSDKSSIPDFDKAKADAFTEIVLEKIFERIQSALDGFEYNLCDER